MSFAVNLEADIRINELELFMEAIRDTEAVELSVDQIKKMAQYRIADLEAEKQKGTPDNEQKTDA